MPEAKRDEVPLPEPTFRAINGLHGTDKPPAWLIWDRPAPVPVFAHFPVIDFYTADQLREHGRQCVQAAEQWLPIETAPKDGTHILLANDVSVSEGGWLSDIDQGAEWEGQIGMAGWWRLDDSGGPPTRWKPLPRPPQNLIKE